MKYCCKIVMVLVVFGIFISATTMTTPVQKEIWVVKSSSNLQVDGATNINSFACLVPSYGKNDTLEYESLQSSSNCNIKGEMSIEIQKFDCKHQIMTKDLQKTLKMNTFPTMNIKFLTISALPSLIKNRTDVSGKAQITLAGVVKTFTIQYSSKIITANSIELTGKQNILFSDFNIKPPSKLGGTIKVKNELAVVFHLKLQKI